MMEYSAGIIIVHDGQYLLVKERKTGIWGYPKGHVEEGETEEEAAHRELYEETGLRATLIPDFKETITYKMGNGNDKTVTFFLGRTKEKKVTYIQDDICEHRWCVYDEALVVLTYENVKILLKKARQFLKQRNPF